MSEVERLVAEVAELRRTIAILIKSNGGELRIGVCDLNPSDVTSVMRTEVSYDATRREYVFRVVEEDR